MDHKAELLSVNTVYNGFFKTNSYLLRHSLYAGGMSQAITRECFERFHAVGVLAFDPRRNKVVLIEQFRIGPWVNNDKGWICEIIAGIIEKDEKPENVAIREAEEEAGCKILALEPIHKYYSSPGGSSETLQLYCGAVDSRNIEGLYGLAAEGEDIKAVVVDYEQAVEWLNKGKINNASSIICLQWLILHHEELMQKWNKLIK